MMADKQMVRVKALQWAPFFKEPIFYEDDIEHTARDLMAGRPVDAPVVRPILQGSDHVFRVDVYQVVTGIDVVLAAARVGIDVIEVEADYTMSDGEAIERATYYRDQIMKARDDKKAVKKALGSRL